MNNAFLLTMTVHFALCLNADPVSTPAPTAASYSEAEPPSPAAAAPTTTSTAGSGAGAEASTTTTPMTPMTPPRPNATSGGSAAAMAPPPPPTGTVAPLLLAHIFDTHSPVNKHHHHDHRWGPHFEHEVANATNVTVQAGETANLNCRISLLQDKTVSWVRRSGQDSGDMQLLTVGVHTYSGDERYTVQFQYPNNWRLQVRDASRGDAGLYECQVSTHPPRATQYFLHVNAPEVMIVDEQGRRLHDKYYEADSTIQLSCLVRHVAMTSSVVTWLHGDRALNYDTTRGGISVRTDLTGEGANSSLSVARVDKADSGNYTCAISPSEFATIAVHVLNESLAELHLSGCPRPDAGSSFSFLWLLAVFFLLAHDR